MATKVTQQDLEALDFEQLLDLADEFFDVSRLRGQAETDTRRAKLIKILLQEDIDTSRLRNLKRKQEFDEEDDTESVKRARPSTPPAADEAEVEAEEEEQEETENTEVIEGDIRPTIRSLLVESDGVKNLTKNMREKGRCNVAYIGSYHDAVKFMMERPQCFAGDDDAEVKAYYEYLCQLKKNHQTGSYSTSFKNWMVRMGRVKKTPRASAVPQKAPEPPQVPAMIPSPHEDVDMAMLEAEQSGMGVPEAMNKAAEAATMEVEEESGEESEDEQEEKEPSPIAQQDENVQMEEPVMDLVEKAGGDRGVEGVLLGEKDIADVLDLIEEAEEEEPLINLSATQEKIMRCLGLIE